MDPITTKDVVKFKTTFKNEPVYVEAIVLHTVDLLTMDSIETISIVAILEIATGQFLHSRSFEASAFRDLLQDIRNNNVKHF